MTSTTLDWYLEGAKLHGDALMIQLVKLRSMAPVAMAAMLDEQIVALRGIAIALKDADRSTNGWRCPR